MLHETGSACGRTSKPAPSVTPGPGGTVAISKTGQPAAQFSVSSRIDLISDGIGWLCYAIRDEFGFVPVAGERADLAEIAALKKEVSRLWAARDIRKKAAGFSHARRHEVRLHCQTPPHLARQLAVRRAGCVAIRLPRLAKGHAFGRHERSIASSPCQPECSLTGAMCHVSQLRNDRDGIGAPEEWTCGSSTPHPEAPCSQKTVTPRIGSPPSPSECIWQPGCRKVPTAGRCSSIL